jgi:hypothetical protein
VAGDRAADTFRNTAMAAEKPVQEAAKYTAGFDEGVVEGIGGMAKGLVDLGGAIYSGANAAGDSTYKFVTDSQLESREAEAVTFNADRILMKPGASPSTVFEEMIHATQHRTGRFSRWAEQYGNAGAITKAEYEAAARLLRNQKAYGISDAEHAINMKRMEEFAPSLKKMGIPLD